MFGFALIMFLGKSITNGVDLRNKNYTAVRNPRPRPRYINLTCKMLKPYPFTRTDRAQRESKQVIDKEGFERIGTWVLRETVAPLLTEIGCTSCNWLQI
jgi:hypothetical protein